MLYKTIIRYATVFCILASVHHVCHGARIYIKNWSSKPIVLSGFQSPDAHSNTLQSNRFVVKPGHSLHLTINDHGRTYTNFSQLTMHYHMREHSETETIYFPLQATQSTSFYVTDIGYERFPYDISKTSERAL